MVINYCDGNIFFISTSMISSEKNLFTNHTKVLYIHCNIIENYAK